MASLSYRSFGAGRRLALRLAALCLSGFFVAGAPTSAEAACVAAAINGAGKQIRDTRSITHGIFPRNVCRRALRHCERRLDEIRYETGRARPRARCEIIASGPRAAEIFGPPLEGWRKGPKRYGDDPGYRGEDDHAYRGKDDRHLDDRYADDRYGSGDDRYDGPPPDLGDPGAHDGWRSAERDDRYRDPRDDRYDERFDDRRAYPGDGDYQGGDPLIDDLLRDERSGAYRPEDGPPEGFRPDDGRYGGPDDRYTPYEDDRSAQSCNIDACAARYKTFRASDCSYKPTLYERRRCPL